MKQETFQQWYESQVEYDPNDLSANTFGTIVWQYQQEKIDKMRDLLEQCLYWTSMRDPEINGHKHACDMVQSLVHEFIKESR